MSTGPVAPELGAIVPHPPTFRLSELAPDVFPALITVFCDACGVEVTEDVIVHADDAPETRFGYLRAHLRRKGWRCDGRGDFCAACH